MPGLSVSPFPYNARRAFFNARSASSRAAVNSCCFRLREAAARHRPEQYSALLVVVSKSRLQFRQVLCIVFSLIVRTYGC